MYCENLFIHGFRGSTNSQIYVNEVEVLFQIQVQH